MRVDKLTAFAQSGIGSGRRTATISKALRIIYGHAGFVPRQQQLPAWAMLDKIDGRDNQIRFTLITNHNIWQAPNDEVGSSDRPNYKTHDPW